MTRHDYGAAPYLAGLCALLALPAFAALLPRTKPDREIPLKEIYTSSSQEGLSRLPVIEAQSGYKDLEVVQKSLNNCLLTTLFVVQGDDVATAIRDARYRLTGIVGRESRADRKAREESTRSWLVLFLGIGPSAPNQWTIRSVEVFGERVQVNCDTSERKEYAVLDSCYYLYWIPLGELKKGPFTLQLVDAPSGSTLLLRKTTIGPVE
jgi:hypothetical protein